MDKKIELNNKIISELEQMAKELYDYWFVQFDFPDANGNPYRSSGGKMVHNPTLKREIPENWEVKTLNEITTIIGGSTPSTAEPRYFTTDGVCWITPKDLSENKGAKYIFKGQTDLTNSGVKSASLPKLPRGSVLMSSRAPIGYVAVAMYETTTNQGLKSFIPNKGWGGNYIFHTIKHIMPVIESKASGSTFKEVAASDLRSLLWCFAPIDISEKFCTLTKFHENELQILLTENKRIITLRDWLLPMLMNGQVTVQAETTEETKPATPRINLSQQRNQRFELWLSNQGVAARGEIDKATLREIFDAMDEDDK